MELQILQQKIYEIRGLRVMLDFDLAELYEVENKKLKQAVRRNIDRFPFDFMIELTREEYNSLRSQFVTLENGRGKFSKFLPFAFTEQGVAMLSSVLNSSKAVQINIQIIRAFVLLRQLTLSNSELAIKIKQLETKYDKNFDNIFEAINYLLKKDNQIKHQVDRKQIGFKSDKP
jgi:hypothetical protein